MNNTKIKILNAIAWLLRMEVPKIHVYTFQKVFDKREIPLSSIKQEFEDGLIRYVNYNKYFNLTMKSKDDVQTITFKILIADGKK